MNLRSFEQLENSKIKISSINEFILACIHLGEDTVLKVIRDAQTSQHEQIKEFILNHITSRFELSPNFMRSKRIRSFNRHQTLCFAVIIFQFRKYFSWSYKYICDNILMITKKNDVTYYLNKLNNFKDNSEDKYYIKLISEIDNDIKNFVTKTIKTNNNGQA